MKLILVFLNLAIFSNLFAGDETSGCLIRSGNKIRVDVKCECLAADKCLKPKTLEYSAKFFNTKDVNNNSVFSEKEKKLFKETYDLSSKINELTASGLGDSEKAKALYFSLDKVNSDLSIELSKNKNINHKANMKNYASIRKKKKQKDDKRLADVKKYLKSNSVPAPELGNLPPEEPKNTIKAVNQPSSVKKESPTAKSEAKSDDKVQDVSSLSGEEKAHILNNLKMKDYELKDSDSLFDIVSKTYKGKAYKKLLSPAELERGETKEP